MPKGYVILTEAIRDPDGMAAYARAARWPTAGSRRWLWTAVSRCWKAADNRGVCLSGFGLTGRTGGDPRCRLDPSGIGR